jgi:hypothetical protein
MQGLRVGRLREARSTQNRAQRDMRFQAAPPPDVCVCVGGRNPPAALAPRHTRIKRPTPGPGSWCRGGPAHSGTPACPRNPVVRTHSMVVLPSPPSGSGGKDGQPLDI